jgi:3-dehydroquinate dehydratase-2
MRKVLVLNGPNLNRLGMREPDIYGSTDYTNLVATLKAEGATLGLDVDTRQTNSEAEMITWLHEAVDAEIDVVINPAAFTHYSYAIRDAAVMVTKGGKRLIEVHLSNPHTREEFRHTSVISGVATGVIAGFGVDSYRLALSQLAK